MKARKLRAHRSAVFGQAVSSLGGLAGVFALGIVTTTASAQAMYRIKPLGYLGGCISAPIANGFNDKGQVTGEACNANGDWHAFLWRNDGTPMVDLGPAEVGSSSIGYAINASGLVAGTATDSTGTYGFVSSGNGAPPRKIVNTLGGVNTYARDVNDSGQVTGSAHMGNGFSHPFVWKAGSPMLDLGALDDEGYPDAGGRAINASGQVAGTAGDQTGGFRAFIWKNDGTPLLDLGSLGGYRTSACCINASGQVAGNSSVSSAAHPHAFLWRNDGTRMLDLGTLARGSLSGANALNDAGQVAGWSYTYFYKRPHGFVWLNDGTPMKDLGTFGGTTSNAADINASGQVTGSAKLTGDTVEHAFLWRNDGTRIQDLNKLIDPLDPLRSYVTLTNGRFINASGDILAQGTDKRKGDGLFLLKGTVLTLSPRSIAFGEQKVSTTSAARLVTVTNTSAAAVPITSVALAGPGAGQFAYINGCGSSLAGKAQCVIKVTFRPTSKGSKTATLNVNGGGGGLRSVRLSGTGV
ncbi:MAG TPA: choice-of-anchor D domain-containing protein [Steroidobacteraceae bacterium]|nr:choice-of-anchor D domain-containing protein [Steroidobacteraceae bacterium]